MARVCSRFSAPAQWFTTVIDIGGRASLRPRTKSLACWPPFPDDDPSLHFNPAQVTAVSLEIGGGAQRFSGENHSP